MGLLTAIRGGGGRGWALAGFELGAGVDRVFWLLRSAIGKGY